MLSTEQKAAPKLEQVLKEGQASEEQEEVSEAEVTQPADEVKETEGEKVEAEKEETETPDAFESRVQTEVDKRSNSYRDKRESDTALIRSLHTQVKELKTDKGAREGNKRIETILSGREAEELETEGWKDTLKEANQLYQSYKEKSAEVEETAQFIGDMTEKLPQNIVKEFGLDDANPNVRAVNGVKFLDETVSVFKHNQDFLMAMEGFLPRGDELRKQLEELVEGMAEFNDDKSKKLFLKDRLQGVKITPRKKPPAPSDGSGGLDLSKLSGRELLKRGFAKDEK